MNRILNSIAFLLMAVLISCQTKPAVDDGYPIKPVPLDRVTVNDNFWLPRIERNRTVTIPYTFGKCEETGRIGNFAKAARLMKGDFIGERYNDSDVFKIMEGACYSLIQHPDPILQRYVDSLVTLVAGAQEKDGYLYTTRTINSEKMAPGAGRERWIDERVSHELYNIGHMYEAAVAHYYATGKRTFLDVAIKSADLVNREFGWGKREIAPGHQEIEIGLVRLYRVTGEKKYLDLAKFFLDVRGKQEAYLRHPPGTRFAVYNDSVYLQMHKPVLQQDEAVGHAVRAAYMYSAMADVSEATGNKAYLKASDKLWENVVNNKMYVTGGIGSVEESEAFGPAFSLPNISAYTETCASVANVFWNDRLFRASGDARYIDILEHTMYNGLISGVSLDGENFFYTNPLESDGSFKRSGWFDCSCCPGNIVRFMPSMGQYIYSTDREGIYVNLFIGSSARLSLKNIELKIIQVTDYPWEGKIELILDPSAETNFTVRIRIPGFNGIQPIPGDLYSFAGGEQGHPEISINGEVIDYKSETGFALLDRKWKAGDKITVSMPMEIRQIVAREEVKADSGRIAFSRGPLVFCIEEIDNNKVRNISVGKNPDPKYEYRSDLLTGVGTIKFKGFDSDGTGKEYTAIPYFAWANRGKGEMIVWLKKQSNNRM
jgi:DUF1680 family protein